MPESDPRLAKIVAYMKSHWPSQVKEEWQVSLDEYPKIAYQVLQDFIPDKTTSRHLIRIAGVSGSGKTTQLLPAVEAYCEKNALKPVLVAARRFAVYHPHYKEIADFYGETEVRKHTDEFSTIMMFLVLSELVKQGYDIILDVTLLDPSIENILQQTLKMAAYEQLLLLIAVSPEVTEKHLAGRSWRHSRETELEFIRATKLALSFYAESYPLVHTIIWNVFDTEPVYDGKVKGSIRAFEKYSALTDIPDHDEDKLRAAKIAYLSK